MRPVENVSKVYDHYYKYDEITEILTSYSKDFPSFCKLEELGKSGEGRSIWLLKVTDTAYGDFDEKPAYYVEGNIHAGEVTGCMVCMYFLDSLFTNIESEEVKTLLKDYTVYVAPRISPDGSEYYLTTPDSVRSINRPYPTADDLPGLHPCDLDGDGVIRRMRVKSPYGIWKVSEKDPRVMARRGADETVGTFYNVYTEGMMTDYDGIHVKDAPSKYGFDFNRNYPAGWQPEHVQSGAAPYPLYHPETRANADFLLTHKNICSIVDMHTSGGMIIFAPSYKDHRECNPQDMKLLKVIGKMAAEESGYPLISGYDEFDDPKLNITYGGFDDFGQFAVGVPTFTIECWDLAVRSGVKANYPPVEKSDEELENDIALEVKWLDENLNGEGFKNWEVFQHPQLGEVEIGGFDFKFTMQNPPVPYLPQELKKLAGFFYRGIKALPKISFEKVKVEKYAEGLYEISATVMNSGFLPSYVFKDGLRDLKISPLTAEIEGCTVKHGDVKQVVGQLGGYGTITGMNHARGPMSMEVEECEKKVSWVVAANEGDTVTLKVSGSRIGSASISVIVK